MCDTKRSRFPSKLDPFLHYHFAGEKVVIGQVNERKDELWKVGNDDVREECVCGHPLFGNYGIDVVVSKALGPKLFGSGLDVAQIHVTKSLLENINTQYEDDTATVCS